MVETLMANAPDSIQTKIKDKQKDLLKKVSDIESKFMEPQDVKGYTNVIDLQYHLYTTGSYLNTSPGEPGSNAKDQLRLTHLEVEKLTGEVNAFLEKEWKEFKEVVTKNTWPVFKTIDPLK